jgi:hypothetical protein
MAGFFYKGLSWHNLCCTVHVHAGTPECKLGASSQCYANHNGTNRCVKAMYYMPCHALWCVAMQGAGSTAPAAACRCLYIRRQNGESLKQAECNHPLHMRMPQISRKHSELMRHKHTAAADRASVSATALLLNLSRQTACKRKTALVLLACAVLHVCVHSTLVQESYCTERSWRHCRENSEQYMRDTLSRCLRLTKHQRL